MSKLVSTCCVLAAVAASACGGGATVEPGQPPTYGFPPDLRGTSVMVFPVQMGGTQETRESMDREVAFAIREADLEWLLPEDLERAGQRSPGVEIRTTGLPVGAFLQREVKRIGEPLFGYLIRLSGLTGAPVALIPVASQSEAVESSGDVEWSVATAVIDARSGRVVWYGTVAGDAAPAGSPLGVANAAQALVRRLARSQES